MAVICQLKKDLLTNHLTHMKIYIFTVAGTWFLSIMTRVMSRPNLAQWTRDADKRPYTYKAEGK